MAEIHLGKSQIDRARQLLTELELELMPDYGEKIDREFVEGRCNSIIHIMAHLKGRVTGL